MPRNGKASPTSSPSSSAKRTPLIDYPTSNPGQTAVGRATTGQSSGSAHPLKGQSQRALELAFGLDFAALHSDEGLAKLDRRFWGEYADGPRDLVAVARACEAFLVKLFRLDESLAAYRQRDLDFTLLQTIKYKFVKRKAMLVADAQSLESYDPSPARQRWQALGLLNNLSLEFDEIGFARLVDAWQKTPSDDAGFKQAQVDLETARHYSAWAALQPSGQSFHKTSVLFRHSLAVDPEHLLHHLASEEPGGKVSRRVIKIKNEFLEPRQGFGLTDPGPRPELGLDQAKYCLICHNNKTDSCSRGMPGGNQTLEAQSRATPTTFRTPASVPTPAVNALGMTLAGCPLGEKISEFQQLRRESLPIAALAMITRDNPMVAATGHRICNDCSRACVFQQQTPVDIPASETRILEDVLALPWGVEIYSLLTRWNPLRSIQPETILGFAESKPRGDSGQKVLVAGLGPAGFTLAHHLLNQGHQVVAIDGQKIEPLAPQYLYQAIYSWADFQEPLEERTPGGFGGVAEYGITVRWNKNYLKLIHLLLARRARFSAMGGVRLGSQVSIEQAFALGFDHVALALGAGKPRLWDQKNALPRGVRMASDFLMALQLTGAYREDSLASLQIELPAIVVGAGLTAVDTATEALAYYALQVERFARRHAALLAKEIGSRRNAAYLSNMPLEDRARAERFIAHGQILIQEKKHAQAENRPPDLLKHLKAWGGVSLIYRRELESSPAYRLNHEELQKGLAEGITVIEQAEILEVLTDSNGVLSGLRLGAAQCKASHETGIEASTKPMSKHEDYILDAKTVLLALGADRNDFLRQEQPKGGLHVVNEAAEKHPKQLGPESFNLPEASSAQHRSEGFAVHEQARMSQIGDMHPGYAGSVVKAMASAARAATLIDQMLLQRPDASNSASVASQVLRPKVESFEAFTSGLRSLWGARLSDVTQFREGIVELGLHAPAAAQNFRPGQFFKLQNIEALNRQAKQGVIQKNRPNQATNTAKTAAEPLAMTGADVDAKQGRVSTVILQEGTSSHMTGQWVLGQELVLMGPCGTPSDIPSHKKVLLLGGGLGNAVLFSIGQACRAQGCEVTYIAAYRSVNDLFLQSAIEAAADHVVWSFESLESGTPIYRPQDQLILGNILDALRQMRKSELSAFEHLLVIGSASMMAAVAQAFRMEFSADLHPKLQAFASVNAPMQCMMKGICGQCLQAIRDPNTGETRYVFACEKQDQELQHIDFDHLKQRLAQNKALEVQHVAWQRMFP
jgi:NADPH-dependent glutamate synthase beta subunit-like oxidoreductase/NAD(P)H-flavin reductase